MEYMLLEPNPDEHMYERFKDAPRFIIDRIIEQCNPGVTLELKIKGVPDETFLVPCASWSNGRDTEDAMERYEENMRYPYQWREFQEFPWEPTGSVEECMLSKDDDEFAWAIVDYDKWEEVDVAVAGKCWSCLRLRKDGE